MPQSPKLFSNCSKGVHNNTYKDFLKRCIFSEKYNKLFFQNKPTYVCDLLNLMD